MFFSTEMTVYLVYLAPAAPIGPCCKKPAEHSGLVESSLDNVCQNGSGTDNMTTTRTYPSSTTPIKLRQHAQEQNIPGGSPSLGHTVQVHANPNQ